MGKIRLVDVGKMAGVSKSTVSQYLSGRYEYMSADTRERIKEAIDTLNFVPDSIARSMRTDKSFTIGIMVENITGMITSYVIKGIDDYFKKHDYNVLIYNTEYDESIEKKSINALKSFRADGLIIASSGKISQLLNDENAHTLPIVHIHRDYSDLNVCTVHSDYYTGAYEATEYLLGLGHKEIAIFTRDYSKLSSRSARVKGCLDALRANGYPLDEENICVVEPGDDYAHHYRRLMNQSTPPTVLFSMFSDVSVELLSFLNRSDIIVPDAISVIGFDDLPFPNLMKTPLTVVHQPGYEIGQTAAALLLQKIREPDKDIENTLLPCSLIIRDSCSGRSMD